MNDGFVDIHSHTLWGIDDGAVDIRFAIELCELAAESGTKILFLTPHLMYWENAEELYDERNEKTEILKEILDENDIKLELKKGFEVLCDDDIFDVKYFKPYTLCESRYLLIEFDFFKPTTEDVVAWCKYLLSCDVVPIIAHPERYSFVLGNRQVVKELSDLGVLFQVNMGSLAGVFGEGVQDFSVEMLNNGYVDFIGSDAHDCRMRNTDLQVLLEELPEECNKDFLEKAMCQNPYAIIKNEVLSVNRCI